MASAASGHLARSGLPAVSRKQNFAKSHIISPLLTKFDQSRWLDIGPFSVHKHAKKELGQYPAILTSHLVNNPYIIRDHLVSYYTAQNSLQQAVLSLL